MHRQHRFLFTLLFVIVAGLLPAMALAFTGPRHTDAVGMGSRAFTVVVGQDDTLWDLALVHAPSGQDPLAYLTEVIALNDIKATALKPGMVLRLP